MCRNILIVILSSLLTVLITAVVVLQVGLGALLSVSTYQPVIDQIDIGQIVIDTVEQGLGTEAASLVESELVVDRLADEYIVRNLDSVLAWLGGGTEEWVVYFPYDEIQTQLTNEEFAQVVAAGVAQQAERLPQCTEYQEQVIGSTLLQYQSAEQLIAALETGDIQLPECRSDLPQLAEYRDSAIEAVATEYLSDSSWLDAALAESDIMISQNETPLTRLLEDGVSDPGYQLMLTVRQAVGQMRLGVAVGIGSAVLLALFITVLVKSQKLYTRFIPVAAAAVVSGMAIAIGTQILGDLVIDYAAQESADFGQISLGVTQLPDVGALVRQLVQGIQAQYLVAAVGLVVFGLLTPVVSYIGHRLWLLSKQKAEPRTKSSA